MSIELGEIFQYFLQSGKRSLNQRACKKVNDAQ
jgi:hypothetical protein